MEYGRSLGCLEQKKYPVLQQHFLGWTITTPTPTFKADEIVFMDFDIPQKNTTQFMYILPFSPNKALVEYTLFSPQLLEKSAYEKALKEYLNQKEISSSHLTHPKCKSHHLM